MAESHDPPSTVSERRSPIARHRFDWTSDQPSSAVVEAVAAAADADPTGLEPLTDVVDPDALDGMLATGTTGWRRDIEVSFRYEGYLVSVGIDGTLELRSSGGEN